jgi:hypothetical protein
MESRRSYQEKAWGYLLGRSSGGYVANNTPLYSKSAQFRHATIGDTVGKTFQPRYLPQERPPHILQNFNPLYRPHDTMDDQRNRGLSLDAIQKIQEFKALMNKYPRYHTNPDGIIRLAVYNSINGDNTLLDDKLEQLRTIDSLAKY